MTYKVRHDRRRGGFTLVEMLVSAALIVFIMVILVSVFSTSLQSLRNLRGVGDMQEHLRYASNLLRRDLAAPHFGRESDGLRGPHLSQQRADLYDWSPPREGYFRIYQGRPSVSEGQDGDQIDSYVMNPAGLHYLAFTVRLEPNAAQGTGRDRYFMTSSFRNAFLSQTPVPAPMQALYANIQGFSKPEHLGTDGYFYSPWAEVAYFLKPTGQTAGSTPRYTLYRRRRILADGKPATAVASLQIPKALAAQLPDVSIYDPQAGAPPVVYLNTPSDVAAPFRRLGMNPIPPGFNGLALHPPQCAGVNTVPHSFASLYDDALTQQDAGGDDILLEDVLSMDIKVHWDVPGDSRINRVPGPRAFYNAGGGMQNPDYPFDDLPPSPANFGNDALRGAQNLRVFDTWCDRDVQAPLSTGPVHYSKWNAQYENGMVGQGNDPRFNIPYDAATIPLRIRVKALQIRLRVWDVKTEQARQVTIIQDL